MDLLSESQGRVVTVGLPVELAGSVYNCIALLGDGKLLGIVPKRYLANDGLHYEARWFRPWRAGEVTELPQSIPFGDLIFDFLGVRIGFEICEDAWVPGRPGGSFASSGVDVLLNPSASHFSLGKRGIRLGYLLEGSRSYGCVAVFCNLLGCESGRVIFDGDTLIANSGLLVSAGPRFSLKDFVVTACDVDLDKGRLHRRKMYALESSPRAASRIVSLPDLQVVTEERLTDLLTSPVVEQQEQNFFVECTLAATLGLFDYLRKSRSQGFVVSLSGGADSTMVVSLAALTIQRVWADLSLEERREKLSFLAPEIISVDSRSATELLLTAVYQRTSQNSAETFAAAQAIAQEIGAAFYTCDIDTLVQGYRSLVEGALQRQLSWENHDVPLQNVQARVRSPLIWLFANIQNALLLTTGNRSESSVGYVTMDGDSSGGINPIAGLSKDFIRRWIRWINSEGLKPFEPLQAAGLVADLLPSAELRPHGSNQTDEADLMPYELLQAIEGCMVRDKKSPRETYQALREVTFETCHVTDQELRGAIKKFYRLWSINQWKRERFAPSFHLDEYSIDPRGWCRFPILSAGFGEELEELEDSSQDIKR
jgi:NAD+ synthase (glutamine-hydrolysing)